MMLVYLSENMIENRFSSGRLQAPTCLQSVRRYLVVSACRLADRESILDSIVVVLTLWFVFSSSPVTTSSDVTDMLVMAHGLSAIRSIALRTYYAQVYWINRLYF